MSKPLIPYDELKSAREIRKAVKLRDPVKAKNEKRKGERFPELRDPDRMAWVRTEPCIVTGKRTGEWIDTLGSERHAIVEAAHMRSRGAAGDDTSALPVERWLHREQHEIGIKSWAKKYRLDIPALLASQNKRYALYLAERAAKQAKA